jgi:hypothetical protein
VADTIARLRRRAVQFYETVGEPGNCGDAATLERDLPCPKITLEKVTREHL